MFDMTVSCDTVAYLETKPICGIPFIGGAGKPHLEENGLLFNQK